MSAALDIGGLPLRNATVSLHSLDLATAPRAIIRVSGAAWKGGFSASELVDGWPTVPVERIGDGAMSKVRVRE